MLSPHRKDSDPWDYTQDVTGLVLLPLNNLTACVLWPVWSVVLTLIWILNYTWTKGSVGKYELVDSRMCLLLRLIAVTHITASIGWLLTRDWIHCFCVVNLFFFAKPWPLSICVLISLYISLVSYMTYVCSIPPWCWLLDIEHIDLLLSTESNFWLPFLVHPMCL